MRFVSRLALIFVSAVAFVATGSVAHATAQEAFICSLNEGKTIEDLLKVAGEFKAAIQDIKGGKDYQARILTPIASQNLSNIIWIGQMPSFAAMAAFSDAYNGSAADKKMNPKFQAVADCESRSFWQVHRVK